MTLLIGTCSGCLFWKRARKLARFEGRAEIEDQGPAPWGDCRRYAPRGAVVINEAASGSLSGEVWPWASTQEDDWCGEYITRNPL